MVNLKEVKTIHEQVKVTYPIYDSENPISFPLRTSPGSLKNKNNNPMFQDYLKRLDVSILKNNYPSLNLVGQSN